MMRQPRKSESYVLCWPTNGLSLIFSKLHAGEMTAQELRTAQAVARGIAATIRNEIKIF